MLNLLRLEPGVESRAEVFRLFLGFFIQKNLIIRETKGAESRRKFFGSTALQKYLKITFSRLSARLHIPGYVFCSSGMANWWNMFPTSAVMAYGWRRNLWMTPRRALFRSGPWRTASLIRTPSVLAADSNTILSLAF